MVQKLGHELCKYLAVLQPVAVLGEAGRVPDRIVRRKPHEPAVQKIVVQLLHQLAFRPNAVEHLQQQCAQQLLWRDRGTSFAGVKLPKVTAQLTQNIADKLTDLPQRAGRRLPDLPQRVLRRHQCLRRDVRKQPALIRKSAPHASPRRFMIMIESSTAALCEGFFSRLLEPFPFRLNRNGALDSCFDAFSSTEPVSTSLENALACKPTIKSFLALRTPERGAPVLGEPTHDPAATRGLAWLA